MSWITRLLQRMNRPSQPIRRRPARPTYRPGTEALEDRLVPANVSFGVIGDYGNASQGEKDVASLVKSWNPALILTVGDNNYSTGSAATIDRNIGQFYHDFIGNYQGTYGAGSATNRFFPALGNHDWGTPGAQPHLDYFTLPGNERYYKVSAGPVDIFVIDSDANEPDGRTATSKQAVWLRGALAASTAQWQVVAFHHPPYSSGEHGGSTAMQWPFAQWGADAVLAGHEHDYERFAKNNIPYFVNGLGGAEMRPFGTTVVAGSQVRFTGDYGAMRVDASDTQISFQFVTRAGKVIDTYTITAATNLPAVTVTASDAAAAETGANPATFTVSRTGSTADPLTIAYAMSGTAANGTDYAKLPGTVTIPAGAASATFTVNPTDDAWVEGKETAIVSLAAGSTYTLGSTRNATATIADDESYLVASGSAWKFLDNGSNQGTAWRGLGFDDAAWRSGNAQLGYGDGDEKTVVGYGADSANKYITTYLRRSFNVADPTQFKALSLRLMRDDGAVVYLNGVEVARSNMPTGTIGSTTRAASTVNGAGESTFFTFTVDPALLRAGKNVLAVEIHQAAPSSSDISFDARLIGSTGGGASTTLATTSTRNALATTSSTVTTLAATATLPTFGDKQSMGNVNTSQITEASGLATSWKNAGVIWTHNDSGDSSRLFALNMKGQILATYQLYFGNPANGKRVPAIDWEDMAIGPGPEAGVSYIYVADIGDNPGSRNTVQIYRFKEPTISNADNPPSAANAPVIKVGDVERFDFQYVKINPDGSKKHVKNNAETLMVDPVTGDLYVVAKAGKSSDAYNERWVFRAPASSLTASGTVKDLTYVTKIVANSKSSVTPSPTGGAISRDGSLIAIKNYQETFIWVRQPGQTIEEVLKAQPKAPVILYTNEWSETITWAQNGSGFYTLKEGKNEPLYFWPLTGGGVSSKLPAAPSNLTASTSSTTATAALTAGGARLGWTDNSTNEGWFRIERSTDGVNFKYLDTVSANVVNFTDSSVQAGKKYYYRVRAVNQSGYSAWSNLVSVTPV